MLHLGEEARGERNRLVSINLLVKLGSPDVADTDKMGETCDLTDGTQELFVEQGEMPYGDGTCTKEEQAGWKPEATPGPLAKQAQPAAA